MKRKLFCIVALLASLSFFALPALGADDEEGVKPQARFLGYEKEYKVESANIVLVYFSWVLFIAGSVGVLFIKTKRTFQD